MFDDDLFSMGDSIEVEEVLASEVKELTHVGRFEVLRESKSEEILKKAYKEVSSKYNLDLNFESFSDFLDDLANFNVDDPANDLVVSKIASSIIGRTILKGVVTQAKLVNKVFETLENTINSIASFDEITIAMVSKGFEYLDALTRLEDRYKSRGAEESLKHLGQEEETLETSRSKITDSDIQELIKSVRKSSGARSSQEDNRV